MRFETAVSPNPVCNPARSCLLSGQHSRTCTGRLTNFTAPNAQGLQTMPEYPAPQRRELLDPTIAECFQKLGYDTALFGKWHVEPAPSLLGFDYSLFPRVHHRHTGQTFVEIDGHSTSGEDRVVAGFSVEFEAQAVESYLQQRARGETPFFVYYNISPPHMPLLNAPEKYLRMFGRDQVPIRANAWRDGQMTWNEHWFKV